MKSFKSKKSKEFDHWAAGAVLITRKKKTPLITLNDFIASAKQGSLKNEPKIKIVIDGKLIEDPEGYSIETSCIKKVDILINEGNGAIIHSDTTPTIIITTKNKKRS